MWEAYRDHYGPQGDPRILVAQGTSRDFNTTLPQSVVDRALASDPDKAMSEYLGKFRDDISSYLTHEAVMRCVDAGVAERPPVPGNRHVAFCDPSGGSSDAMTLAISHKEGQKAIVDYIAEVRPPFDPEEVVESFVAALKLYGLGWVYGDRFGGVWVQAAFLKLGVGYRVAPVSKSKIYLDFAPLVNSGRVLLLDNERLISQLVGLERRTGRGTGLDVIDHGPSAHDDTSNSVAGSVIGLGFGDVIKPKPAPTPPPPPWRYDIRVGELFGVAGEPDRRPGRGDGRIRL